MTRILIVEDEERIRKMYAALLASEGFDVLEAADAMTASCLLNREPLDIMLLDINMPQVYGSVLYDVMRDFHRKVKVIVASVYPIDEQKRMIRGAADYYDKSQSIDLLLEKIRAVEKGIPAQKRILIIDDEPKIRQIYRHYLEEKGYTVFEAPNGAIGLETLQKTPGIALVVLDLALPGKSGAEIHAQIKARFPEMKILVSSVFNQANQKNFLPSADAYYEKTQDASELAQKIEKLLPADGAG
jgi:DNA-binding response OmpR family regulator